MLKLWKILVTALVLAASAAVLSACGQKGPLVLPTSPESMGRATLPQTLNPLRSAPASAAAPAAPAARPATAPTPETNTRP